MQLVVESACVADGLAVVIPTPEGGRGRPAVGADGALTTVGSLNGKKIWSIKSNYVLRFDFTYNFPLWLDERPVGPVHLVIETAGIAKVVAVAITAPQRS